jgi:ubiquinone/menaquinone biosynthesis C-methylase UbiE
VIRDASAAYEGLAGAWASGPSRVYDRLAEAIVAAYPDSLAGRHVLDIGAGTGAVTRALTARGARTTAVDIAPDMVEHMRADGINAVVGDICALPFPNATFDGAVAAFSVSHVADPVAALSEARRVVRGGRVVIVGVFAAQPVNASKEVVDSVAEQFGFVRPGWYTHWKTEVEPAISTPEKLRSFAEQAGFEAIDISERAVATGVNAPEDIVAARLGMAHLAPFVASLSVSQRAEFIRAAVAVVAQNPQPLRPIVLLMSARAPGSISSPP